MSAFRRGEKWVAKFQRQGEQVWVPGGPWPTKREAQQAERRQRERVEGRRTEETCGSFSKRWVEEWPRQAVATRKLYSQAAERFGADFGPTPLDEVERLSARTWALGVPRNLSKIVGTMYEDARNIGLVEGNPFSNLRLPATEKTEEVCPPTTDEYRRLLEACGALGGYGAEFRALIQFAAWTGVRAGELHALRWEDIDGDRLWVRRSRKLDGALGKPKNGKERRIAFLPPARVLSDVPRRAGSSFIFHSRRGEPLNKGNHHYAWREVRATSGINGEREVNGLPKIRWHDLRHFCATQLLEMGLDHFAVSVQLGHEDGGALVMSRYGHPSKDAAQDRLLRAFAVEEHRAGSAASAASGASHAR